MRIRKCSRKTQSARYTPNTEHGKPKSKLFAKGDESLDFWISRDDAQYLAACNLIAKLERDLQAGKVFGVRMARWWAYTGGAFADAIVVVTWVS